MTIFFSGLESIGNELKAFQRFRVRHAKFQMLKKHIKYHFSALARSLYKAKFNSLQLSFYYMTWKMSIGKALRAFCQKWSFFALWAAILANLWDRARTSRPRRGRGAPTIIGSEFRPIPGHRSRATNFSRKTTRARPF
jgi:hypothetical protein